jgi:hypothetical protein
MEQKLRLLEAFDRMISHYPDVSVHELYARFLADADEEDAPIIMEHWKSFKGDIKEEIRCITINVANITVTL